MMIDVFPHIFPRPYKEWLEKVAPAGLAKRKRILGIPVLMDLDERFRIMDRYEGYTQVLTLSGPLEDLAGPDLSPELAKVANESMAEIVEKYPDRFPAFVASLPMNNPEAAVKEIDRAINQLGATGVQIYTNVNGRPLDEPEFSPIFERMAALGLPIWLHPARSPAFADYPTETRSRYDLWWAFGWPYDTTIAMGRLVFSGLFDRLPDLKIIVHHLGAMLPYFEGRAGAGLDQLGARTDYPEDIAAFRRLKKRPLEYFHMFFGDTAVSGSCAAIACGLAFFGADRVLFGTDMPYDPEQGPGFIRDTIAAIEQIHATPEEKAKIFEGNARRLLRLRLP